MSELRWLGRKTAASDVNFRTNLKRGLWRIRLMSASIRSTRKNNNGGVQRKHDVIFTTLFGKDGRIEAIIIAFQITLRFFCATRYAPNPVPIQM